MGAKDSLRGFKEAHGLTWAEVASRLGISHDYARKLGCGDRARVSKAKARRIERRTRGELRVDDLTA